MSHAQINDIISEALTGQGYENVLQWLQAGGATSDDINLAWSEWLAIQGYSTGTRSDNWFDYLRASGYTGSISDMVMEFWEDQFIGPELLVNGSFVGSAAPWVLGTGWIYSAGAEAVLTFPVAVSTDVSQALATIVNGNTYRVSFSVLSYGEGTITPKFTGSVDTVGSPVSSNGIHTQDLVIDAGGNITDFVLDAAGPYSSIIGYVSIKEVI